MELTRREMLKLSLLGGAALMLPLERKARTSLKVANRIPESRLPKPFQVPFATPPVLQPVKSDATTDYYRMTMKSAQLQILPGDFGKTTIYGYNGIVPGPTLSCHRGRPVVVRHINGLPRNGVLNGGYPQWTSVHLHGSASLPQYDGYASDITRPGEYKDYHFPNIQDARTLWYHDHGVHHTAENVYSGMAAQYHLHDELELSLPIPHGRYDVPLIVMDAMFATDGSLVYDDNSESGVYGDVILVNGRPWPVMKVERRKYHFRLLNASVSRSYHWVLDNGDPFAVIGTDAGLMRAPQQVTGFRHGMAERYEIVIDFARYKIGDRIVLKNLQPPNNVSYDSVENIMAFDVANEPTDTSNNSIPDLLNPNEHVMGLTEADAKTTRQFRFERKSGQWTINGKTWEDVIESKFQWTAANPGLDDVEIWELKNPSGGWFHPVHIHMIDYKILDRSITDEFGQVTQVKEPFPYEVGPKDVAYVGENETVRVIARFAPQRGKYMMHCHNLPHEDHDMMVQFEVGQGGDDPIKSAPARPVAGMPPLGQEPGGDNGGNPAPVVNTAPVIGALWPAPNTKVRTLRPTIRAIVRDKETNLSRANVKLFVDGRRIKIFGYDRVKNRLTCKRRLRPGRHTVKITATDAKKRSTTRTWSFKVVG